jgi:hypothetical protein
MQRASSGVEANVDGTFSADKLPQLGAIDWLHRIKLFDGEIDSRMGLLIDHSGNLQDHVVGSGFSESILFLDRFRGGSLFYCRRWGR